MAVTAIWRVKGWLGKSLIYIRNPDKTTNPEFYEQTSITTAQKQSLSDVISYAMREQKTSRSFTEHEPMESFVSGVNCVPEIAREEMQMVKAKFGKEDGTIAYHGYQSFATGEVTPEVAHEIGVKLATQLWGDRYQVVVATHLDTPTHVHNHFVVNTVSFIDGKKYHRTKQDYQNMRTLSDALCAEYGLSVIQKPGVQRTKTYGEIQAERRNEPTWRDIIKKDVDEAIRTAMTDREFLENLQKLGYECKIGKDISVRPEGKERYVRLVRSFGPNYSLESICRRILEQKMVPKLVIPARRKTADHKLSGSWKQVRKVKGFRALYFHYCYLLGVFPKKKPENRRRMHFLLREDLLKLDQITNEARLLGAERIDTMEQLTAYQEKLNSDMEGLKAQRKELRRQQQTKAVKEDPELLQKNKEEVSAISAKLHSLRRDYALCDDIAERSVIMENKLKTMREQEREEEKEKSKNELFRRRSRAGR